MKVKIIQKPCTPREMVASLSELLENASTGNEPTGEA
jgi:hypothetical protein